MKIPAPIFIFAAIFAFAGCAQQEPPDTSEADAANIRTDVSDFVAAWNTADNASLATMIAEDIVLMQPDGLSLEGRDVILETMASQYDIEMMQQSATTDEVIALGDHAYARGTWRIYPTRADAADAADAGAVNGKWSALYERQPTGTWHMSRWMWNQPSAVAAAAE